MKVTSAARNFQHHNRLRLNLVLYYTTKKNGDVIKLECDTETKIMRALKSKDHVHFYSLPDKRICKDDRITIAEDGSRWEGDSFNQQPFGFGSFYDGEGNKIYTGFVYRGKKVGFGTEYFVDSHTVDYCGNFINNKRHGWGISYDRNGNKLYEGEWEYGNNNFSSCIVYTSEEFLSTNLNVNELIITPYFYEYYESDFVIENNDYLEYICIMGMIDFMESNIFKVSNCKNVRKIVTKNDDDDEWDGTILNAKSVIIESN